nr:hypothetical protein [uncultured Leptotrichia sp.]
MKKVFISLSLPAFFSLGYELSAYTRAELIQDRLSKIGIKQDVIDETIKFEYDIKDEKNFFTEDGQENDNLLKLKEIYEKDERNETLGGVLVGAYIVGGKKDFKKAREYMDKIAPYSTRFDKLSNEFTYYKLKGDEKKAKFYYNLIKRYYKNSAVMELVDTLSENLDMVMFIETLGDYLAEEDDKTNKEANDLPDGFLYDDKKGIIENKEKNNDSDKEEENLEDTQTYSESVKEILDNGKQTLDSQKQEISKYERIINYFKIPKNQKEFGIPDDYIRGFKLKIAEVKIAKNMMNYGIENAVKYYLDNVSTNDVSYEDVYFNEQSELALYLAVAQMLSVADENVMNKYRKEFENTRVIKLLDEILKNERKNQKSDKPQQEIRNNIKS